MKFLSTNRDGVISVKLQDEKRLDLCASKPISEKEIQTDQPIPITPWGPQDRSQIKTTLIDGVLKLYTGQLKKYRKWWVKFKASSIIFPAREGEYINDILKIPEDSIYSLSYPGTGSSKCIVINLDKKHGFVIGAKPSLEWAKISLTRNGEDLLLQITQNDLELFVIPFDQGWEIGVKIFSKLVIGNTTKHTTRKLLNTPRFSLQMGIRDFFGKSLIKNFSEIIPLIEDYQNVVGPGNIIHLFGTNPYGFDCMFPDYTIDKSLGGVDGLKSVINIIHEMGLLVSHHFNPRIADARWLETNKKYISAIVTNSEGVPWTELYKNNLYYVMNPDNEPWSKLCLKTIKYLNEIGFDYIEIDQIAYQRNLYTKEGGFGKGYQKLLDKVGKDKIKYWIEGVSDIFKLHEDCYFQVLPRDRSQMWETGENRRGYPYGVEYTIFYRTLIPEASISYQIVTEKIKISPIQKRIKRAKKLHAQVYELELGFINKKYKKNLDKVLAKVSEYLKNEKD